MVTFDYLPEFERRAKALAKKYRSFVDDYNTFLDKLERNHGRGRKTHPAHERGRFSARKCPPLMSAADFRPKSASRS